LAGIYENLGIEKSLAKNKFYPTLTPWTVTKNKLVID
jgi:hypothetical protein